MVHELGHAHGRGHAPCAPGGGISGVDGRYPYSGGDTSTWGWDLRSNKLHPPSAKDIMGYCEPAWISDYTYNALADRCEQVNATALWSTGEGGETHWHGFVRYADGRMRDGGSDSVFLPGGELERAGVLDAEGEVVAETHVVRVPLSHSDDELLYVANLEDEWETMVIGDETVSLADVLPPL
jgi:hypothetical protein